MHDPKVDTHESLGFRVETRCFRWREQAFFEDRQTKQPGRFNWWMWNPEEIQRDWIWQWCWFLFRLFVKFDS